MASAHLEVRMEAEIVNIEQPPKRRGGRPRKDKSDLRSKRLNVRFTDAEYVALCKKAESANLTPTDYAHAELVGADMPLAVPKLNIDMYRWLQPLATNLNELAKKAHLGEQVHLESIDLKNVSEQLVALRKALIGVRK